MDIFITLFAIFFIAMMVKGSIEESREHPERTYINVFTKAAKDFKSNFRKSKKPPSVNWKNTG